MEYNKITNEQRLDYIAEVASENFDLDTFKTIIKNHSQTEQLHLIKSFQQWEHARADCD